MKKRRIEAQERLKVKADARAVFCYWAARELGYGLRELGRKLGMTQPGVGYAVSRGERISNLNHYYLMQAYGRNQNLACCLRLEDRFA